MWEPLKDVRGSLTVRQWRVICHPELRRKEVRIWGFKGRKTVHRKMRSNVWATNISHVMQRPWDTGPVVDRQLPVLLVVISGDSAPSGPGPLSKLFKQFRRR